MTDPTPTRAEVDIVERLRNHVSCIADAALHEAAETIDALRDRAKAAERRAYDLAVAIMGGEDAPGYADSIPTQVLVDQQREMASEWLHRVTPEDACRAEAAAWNDAIEAVIAGIEHVKSSRSDQRIAEVDPARRERFRVAAQQCGFLIDDIRALRRAAPTEGEA